MRRLEGKVVIMTGAASGCVTGREFTIDRGKTVGWSAALVCFET
jgi:hypothetical protein